MIQRLAAALALCAFTAVAAAAVQPTTVQFRTDTVALAGGESDSDSAASPTQPLPGVNPVPLLTESLVVGGTSFASAGSIAAAGLFATSAEADSASGFSSASSSARYLSTYSSSGLLDLSVRFDFSGSGSTGSNASSGLSVTVWSGGVAIFDQLFSTSATMELLLPLNGSNHTVDIVLMSEANTGLSGGFATSAAQVAFDVAVSPVPEPASLPLALAGAAMLGFWVRRKRSQSS